MAKIESLDIGTLKIGNSAVTGYVKSTLSYSTGGSTNASVTVADPASNPVALFWDADGFINGGGSSNHEGGGSASFSVKKGSTVLYSNTRSVGTQGHADLAWGGSIIDWTPDTGQVYSTTGSISASGGGGGGSLTGSLVAMYFKK